MPSDKEKTQSSSRTKATTDLAEPLTNFSEAKSIGTPKTQTDVSSGSNVPSQSVFATFDPATGGISKSLNIHYDLKRVQKRAQHLQTNRAKKMTVDTSC